MNEKDIKDINERINKEAEKADVPESLSPENIEKLVKENSQKKNSYKKYTSVAASILALVLVGGIGYFVANNNPVTSERKVNESAAVESQETQGDYASEESYEEDAIAEEAEEKTSSEKEESTTKESTSSGNISFAKDYDELKELVKKNENNTNDRYYYAEDVMIEESAAAESSDSTSEKAIASEAAGSSGSDYSTTNIQEENVDEGDIVKTDGKNFYIMSSDGVNVSILSIDNGQLKKESDIKIKRKNKNNYGYTENKDLYIKDDVLIIIHHFDAGGDYYNEKTTVEFYSVKNPSKPKLLSKSTQSGSYNDSRLSGGYLYLFTRYIPQYSDSKTAWYVPSYNDELLPVEDICIPEYCFDNSYLVMTSFKVENKEADMKEDSIAIYSSGDEFYVSEENIYATSLKYNYFENIDYYEEDIVTEESAEDIIVPDEERTDEDFVVPDEERTDDTPFWRKRESESQSYTEIIKMGYNKGVITPVNKTKVEGKLLNSFSMDEEDGYLRLVATVETNNWNTYNNVYVLDKDLNMTDSITGLADEERIYSARFMGDYGYFVTYRETDPLFTVDLKDPENIEIIGELKIPGFSSYLHFYGEGYLLGIGEDDSGNIKLSMFNISDPTDIKEEDVKKIKDTYYSPALYNHKTVMIDSEKNVIGFSLEGERTEYKLFSYTKGKGFKEEFSREIFATADNTRGFYNGDYLYLIQDYIAESYNMTDDYEKVDDIILR